MTLTALPARRPGPAFPSVERKASMDILHILLAAIIVLGPLIAIHEFGHFWVARRLGVKVLTFSIGLINAAELADVGLVAGVVSGLLGVRIA